MEGIGDSRCTGTGAAKVPKEPNLEEKYPVLLKLDTRVVLAYLGPTRGPLGNTDW